MAVELTELDELQLGRDGLASGPCFLNLVDNFITATVTDKETLLQKDCSCKVNVGST